MDHGHIGRTVLASMLVVAVIALLAVMAASAARADPDDYEEAPTEDWVFNSGQPILISYEEWDVQYNITLTNGTSLKILDCDFSFEGVGGLLPVRIFSDVGCTLDIELCTFDGTGGATGFYIEAHGELYISNSELVGLISNPTTGGGVSVMSTYAQLSYVTMHRTNTVYSFYSTNSNVNISNSEIFDSDGTLAFFHVNDKNPYSAYSVNLVESDFHTATLHGLWFASYFNDGNYTVGIYKTKVHDVLGIGITLEDGQKTYGVGPDAGYGTMNTTMDELELYNIGDQGMFLCSDGKSNAPADLGFFNTTILNSHIYNIKNTGIYDIRYYTISKHVIHCENTVFEDIAMDPMYNRLSAIFTWRYGTVGGGWDLFYFQNCTFRRCNPGGVWYWDMGKGSFGVGGIPRSFYFIGCEFTECTEAAIYRVLNEGGSPGEFLVEGCYFHDNPGHAILMDANVRPDMSTYAGMTEPHAKVMVNNTTFERHGKSVLAVTANNIDQDQEIGYFLENCTIDHCLDYAILIRPNSPKGMLYLHMNDTRINDTMGVFLFYDAEYADTAGFDVRVTDCTIENSVLTGLYVRAQSSLTPEATVLVRNTTIRNAGRDGIDIYTGPTGSAQQVKGFIVIEYVTIEQVDGAGIKITNDLMNALGARQLYINFTTVWTAQQGMIIQGYPGEVWYCTIKDILLENIMSTANRVRVYYCEFTAVDAQKFKAASGGEVFLYYNLTIIVRWDTGAPAIGSMVEMTDNMDNLLTAQTIMQQDGALPTMSMNSYIIRSTGLFSSSPYNIRITCAQVSKSVGVKLDRNMVVLTIMRDNVNPEVYINYPRPGHSQQSTTLDVRGSAWDYQSGIDRVELSLDGVNWEVASGTLKWSHTFHVSAELISETGGMFDLRARAIDYAGNSRTTYVFVRVDPTPPKVLVNFPTEGYITSNPRCLVRGVTEPGSLVTVNGLDANVIVSMFTIEVTLVEGPNTLTVIAVDPMGNVQVVRVTVRLDTQKPYFQLVSPTEGATVNQSRLTIIAQLEADLEVTIDDQLVPYGSEAYPMGTGSLELPRDLVSTETIIHFRVKDLAGNVLTIDRLVVLDDTPPWIKVTTPLPGTTFDHPEIIIVGTTEATSRFLINDDDVTLQNGFFQRAILCIEGDNSIVLTSIDPAGNVNTQLIVVRIDTRPPYLAITSPRGKVTTANTMTISVVGTVWMDGVVTTDTVTVNGVEHTLSDPVNGIFSVPVDLVEGRNEITVMVEDAVGNRANQTVEVWLDTAAPTLVIELSPTAWKEGKRTTPSRMVDLTGYTEPGSIVYVNGVLVLVGLDGSFLAYCSISEKGETTITVVSTDAAGNARTVVEGVTYARETTGEVTEDEAGRTFLYVAILIFVLVLIVVVILIRMGRRRVPATEPEDKSLTVEVEAEAEAEAGQPKAALAATPAPPAATEAPKAQAGEGVATTRAGAPAAPGTSKGGPRPIARPQTRRTPTVRAKPQPVKEMGKEDKGLSDQGAEDDIIADESEQEVD